MSWVLSLDDSNAIHTYRGPHAYRGDLINLHYSLRLIYVIIILQSLFSVHFISMCCLCWGLFLSIGGTKKINIMAIVLGV